MVHNIRDNTSALRRVARTVGSAGLVAGGLLALPGQGAAAGAPPSAVHSSALQVTQTWSQSIGDAGSGLIAESSPNVATLDGGGPSVLVGDQAGNLYAYHLSDGSPVAGWPAATGAPINSTPSVSGSTVFIGAGDAASQGKGFGGYEAFNANGSRRWTATLPNTPGGTGTAAVSASLTVGNLQGQPAVVAGTLAQLEGEYNASSGGSLPGFPWLQADSNFSTPALADVYGSGQPEIVEGGASSPGVAGGYTYTAGGHIRVLNQTGNLGQPQDNGGLACQYNTDQEVDSSPAVGQFLAGGAVGIVAGTGTYWPNARTTNQVIAVDSHCNLAWATTLDAATGSSPALVDALGNGALQVAEGTNNGASSGKVWLLNGTNGAPIWSVPATGAIIGSITSADLGNGHQDLIVPTLDGIQILDGATGAQLAYVGANVGFQNSPLVTADANGTIGITVAGYQAGGSQVLHFEVAGTNGALANEAGAWPVFHHDSQLTGNAGTPGPVINVPCTAPAGGPNGYYETGSDGGIFTFGNVPFCGSTGAITLNKPVVGMAATPSGGGYWTVASDGGIFSFGNAGFHGSEGGVRLNSPIVGMASTPSGNGYWLVAADGGIFSFGDATFHGSEGGVRLNSPIVGMASTPSGNGYWMVAADGGVFSFGDAGYHGSEGGVRLNQPVVAMAPDAATGGYWLIAADGGVFSFAAPYFGSTGNLRLTRPIVSAHATGGGSGYRFVASDGGIFDFGTAQYYGSEGGKVLNKPIAGGAGF